MSTCAIRTTLTLRRLADVSAPTIGLFAINSHVCAEPDNAARIATLAERVGYDSLWAGEHVVVPRPRVDPSPMEPDEPILDPLVALAHLAARTERVLLGTGVIILPQRNPLVLAKEVATLDVVSKGRVVLGVGVNVSQTEAELPADARMPPTSLELETGSPVDRCELLVQILHLIESRYAAWVQRLNNV